MRRNLIIITLFLGLSTASAQQPTVPPSLLQRTLSHYDAARLLRWQPLSCQQNLCCGYFEEPEQIRQFPKPLKPTQAAVNIQAEHTLLAAEGPSLLEGNVILEQPGRIITADRATVYRNSVGEITSVELYGNVHYQERGKHLVSQYVFVDFTNKTARLNNSAYRLEKTKGSHTLNAWGTAATAKQLSENVYEFTRASYSTCSPLNPVWSVKASRLHIDQNKKVAKAYHARLYIYDFPILYSPYLSFATEKRRKSGFLLPTFSYVNQNGWIIGIPFYFNLAPNYDFTLTPTAVSQRGFQLDSFFRYLTPTSMGRVDLDYMPYDSKFADFRRSAARQYGITARNIPYLNQLSNDSNSRGSFAFQDSTQFDDYWSSSVHLNYVTDDYYLQDFSNNPVASNADQLLNQAELTYGSDYWQFIGRIQAYQTLHPINENAVSEMYAKLPQLSLNSRYPTFPNQFSFQWESEFTYFDRKKDFETRIPATTGDRIHLRPNLRYSFITPSTYVTPQLYLDLTSYSLTNPLPGDSSHITRVLPMFAVDSGWFWEDSPSWSCFTQTIEPRLFYLYVPFTQQNEIPLFDTSLPPFSLGQQFRINRFTGYDRIGDANQLTAALTTRILDQDTGRQLLRASIGGVVYFKSPRLCLNQDCSKETVPHDKHSPLLGELSYTFSPHWNMLTNLAWDNQKGQINNSNTQFFYRPNLRHIFNVGYEFVKNGDNLTDLTTQREFNLSRFDVATAWALTNRLSVMANWNYNISHNHPQAYFYGMEYNTCCWAVRFVASQYVTAETVNDQLTVDRTYYIQFKLKGLANFGYNDPASLLTTSIFGYQDDLR